MKICQKKQNNISFNIIMLILYFSKVLNPAIPPPCVKPRKNIKSQASNFSFTISYFSQLSEK